MSGLVFIQYHLIAFFIGFILDLIIGDPYWLPHPVRVIGRLISYFENKLIGTKENPKILTSGQKRFRGKVLVFSVLSAVEFLVVLILVLSQIASKLIHPVIGIVVESIMTFQLLATKCLKVESLKVYNQLKNENIAGARQAVSMIVGRDTENLSEEEITKAAVETVAENTSDGIIAPMIFLALGGPIAGFFYKSINTMDSMVGYKNERYMDFGRFAAKTDDFVNFIPARISAWMMIFLCAFLGKNYSFPNAKKIYLRDRHKHESPNSAHTESVCAGALKIQLAGPAVYEGKIEHKEFLGDDIRKIQYEDIKRVNNLSYGTAILNLLACSVLITGFYYVLYLLKAGK